MNRHNFLKSIAAFFAGLPFIGKALGKEKPTHSMPNVELHLQHMALESLTHCMEDVRSCEAAHQTMESVLREVEVLINYALKEGIEDRKPVRSIRLKWMNILDRERNPHGSIGFARIILTRAPLEYPTDEQQSQVLLNITALPPTFTETSNAKFAPVQILTT